MKKVRICLVIAATFAFSLFSSSVFAAGGGLANDSVLSQHVKEADGTTGQDTNTGSGVKAGHIQDGAVTTGKIADGAVTDLKISGVISGTKLGSHTHSGADITDGTITTLKLLDGSVTTPKIADGAVTNPKIADGAVTDTKITGPISGSKISSTGLNADTVDGKHAADFAPLVHTHNQSDVTGLDSALAGKADVNHNHDGVYQKKYAKVAVVAQAGGDYDDPQTALEDVTSWCGTPSGSNPCLLKVMPGVYNVHHVVMMSYVDIDGSGKDVTKISSGTAGSSSQEFLVAVNITNCEMRDLTIERIEDTISNITVLTGGVTGVVKFSDMNISGIGGTYIYGFIINADSAPILSNVTVRLEAGQSTQILYGIFSDGSPTMNEVKVDTYDPANAASKIGMSFRGGSPSLKDIHVYVGDSIWGSRGLEVSNIVYPLVLKIHSSYFRGQYESIVLNNYLDRAQGVTFLGTGIQFDGYRSIEIYGDTIFKCLYCYDGNFDPIP